MFANKIIIQSRLADARRASFCKNKNKESETDDKKRDTNICLRHVCGMRNSDGNVLFRQSMSFV